MNGRGGGGGFVGRRKKGRGAGVVGSGFDCLTVGHRQHLCLLYYNNYYHIGIINAIGGYVINYTKSILNHSLFEFFDLKLNHLSYVNFCVKYCFFVVACFINKNFSRMT